MFINLKGADLMCGFLLSIGMEDISIEKFRNALNQQKWRGPDDIQVRAISDSAFIGHVRLSVLDPTPRSSQPLLSHCGRFAIIYNGEIYNHKIIRSKYELCCITESDTETIVEGFVKIGIDIFEQLDGMYSIVIVDLVSLDYWVARDRFGIKPLYHYSSSTGGFIFSSEAISIRSLVNCSVDYESIKEWRLIRRPMPGFTFFEKIREVLPGQIIWNGRVERILSAATASASPYSYEKLFHIVKDSVIAHQQSDVEVVSMLSGGVDSSLISALSTCSEFFSVGLSSQNEFDDASATVASIGGKLNVIEVSEQDVEERWRELILLKGEPLYVPNEALIYSLCLTLNNQQKVILTGEGADEVFFGYDRLFRWCIQKDSLELLEFLDVYGYSTIDNMTNRLANDLRSMLDAKSPIEFLEDFFFRYHLPCLLRRMDFASMAASKEARVPFVSKSIVDYMYRRPPVIKIDNYNSKIPLRKMLDDLELSFVYKRPKVGFSTTFERDLDRKSEYSRFQKFNLEVLGW